MSGDHPHDGEDHGHEHDHGHEPGHGDCETCDHNHAEAAYANADPHAAPHEPAPPEPFRLIPSGEMFVRGLVLAAVALVFGVIAWNAADNGLIIFLAVTPLTGVIALLAGWAAVIHLTGGEKFDDHPWV